VLGTIFEQVISIPSSYGYARAAAPNSGGSAKARTVHLALHSVTGLTGYDLSKCFDTLDHDLDSAPVPAR